VIGLPPGWTLAQLGTLCQTIQYGYTARASTSAVGPKMLRITDIQDGKVDWGSVPTCEISDADIIRFRLAPGDLVFARTGATVGKSFLIRQVQNAVFASYLIRMRPADNVNASYLRWFLNSPLYWNQIGSAAAGVAQPNVNATKLSQIEIPIAPAAEQERIVAVIEEEFSRLDAGEAALKRVRQACRTLIPLLVDAATGYPSQVGPREPDQRWPLVSCLRGSC
jgi:type I restriction enzyme S subunit